MLATARGFPEDFRRETSGWIQGWVSRSSHPPPCCSLASWNSLRLLGGRTGKQGGNFSLPQLGWDPLCAPWLGPVGVATPRWPVGPHIHSPCELGLAGLSLVWGLRSHGQVDQNPEQLPAQTCCSGIKVPLCQNN